MTKSHINSFGLECLYYFVVNTVTEKENLKIHDGIIAPIIGSRMSLFFCSIHPSFVELLRWDSHLNGECLQRLGDVRFSLIVMCIFPQFLISHL